jgi:glutamine amidotransferase
MTTVAIVDYGMGNLQSVKNAFEALGATVVIAREPEAVRSADKVIVPGVGAFGEAMATLRSRGWVEVLEAEVRQNRKPLMGLCLGMQLLATDGTEGGACSGLGWIAGAVTQLPGDADTRVPHMGWNDVTPSPRTRMYQGISGPQTFYFVHSYVLEPADRRSVSGVCRHGRAFVASIEQDHIWATQYHPEKSQKAGLQVLRNFLTLT